MEPAFGLLLLDRRSGGRPDPGRIKAAALQYIAYEPVMANLVITNLAGRDVDLHDSDGQAWVDRANQLHIVYCAAPRACAYARIGLNDLLSRASFAETKTRPRLVRSEEAEVKVAGGVMDTRIAQTNRDAAPKLFARRRTRQGRLADA